jgi:hypothetical protein
MTVAAGRANFEAGAFIEASRGCVEGDAILSHHGVGVAWERFRALLCAARSYIRVGDLAAASAISDPLLQQSVAAENLLFQVDLLATTSAWSHVSGRTASTGLAMLNDALSRWPQDGFSLQHAHALVGRGFLLRAMDRPEDAWKAVKGDWAGLERSGLLAIPSVRADAWLAKARSALGWAVEGDSRALSDAEAALAVLAKDHQAWVVPWIDLCEAGVHTIRGTDPSAALSRARAGFESEGLRLGWALAELRAGRERGDDLRSSFGDVDALLRAVAPGRW